MLIGAGALAVSGCERDMPLTASTTPKLDMERLNADVAALAARARPGVLGVGLTNLESGEHFTFEGERRFPMQSVFKMLLAAAVLGEVDDRQMNLDERFVLEDEQLSAPYSPIAAAWPGRRDYTGRELLIAALSDSDNTAADVLMKRIGGPGAVTAWLVSRKFEELRVDRYERELHPQIFGMPSFRPAWRTPEAFAAARAAVPPERRRAAMAAYLRDPRDTATPRDMLTFLTRLNAAELLSAASTRLLLQIMFDTPRGGERLKAGLPEGSRFAHKTGTSSTDQGLNLAYNDVGVAVLPDGRAYGIAAFLSASTASEADRAKLMADLGRALTGSMR
jgi:beta-lactamase class A